MVYVLYKLASKARSDKIENVIQKVKDALFENRK